MPIQADDGGEHRRRRSVQEAARSGIEPPSPTNDRLSLVGAAVHDPTALVIATTALTASGIAALRLSRPAGLLYASSFDTSIYLGSAIRLVHGVVPYRDFVLLQPPGMVLLMAPFALLSEATGSRNALIAVNVLTPLVALAIVVLVGMLIRRRGWRATFVACGLVAVYPFMYNALLNGMLEPVMDVFCLLGAAIIFDRERLRGVRRLFAGGVAFGFAGSVMATAIVPVAVLAALCARDAKTRLLPFVSGVATGFLVPTLPFLALSPRAVLNDIVVAQLSRAPGTNRTPVLMRLAYMTFDGTEWQTVVALATMGLIVVLAFSVVRRAPSPLEWFALATTLLMAALQFVIARYYDHFGVMLIPFMALLLGLTVDRLLSIAPVPALRAAPVVALALAMMVAAHVYTRIENQSGVDYGPIVDSIVPAGQCALGEPYPILVMSDRFSSNLPECTPMVDPYATRLAYDDTPAGRAIFKDAITHANYLVMIEPAQRRLRSTELAPLSSYITSNFHVVYTGGVWFYVRNGYPVANGS